LRKQKRELSIGRQEDQLQAGRKEGLQVSEWQVSELQVSECGSEKRKEGEGKMKEKLKK